MNIVKSTASKVQELEKRLDNALSVSGLRVSEVKKDFGSVLLSDELFSTSVLKLTGGTSKDNLVIQGEIKIRVHEATNLTVNLILDGYVVYSEIRTLNKGLYSWSLIKALTLAPNVEQELVMTLSLSGGGSASLLRYDFFLWGYGESFSLGDDAYEPKLSASTQNDRYVIYLIINNRAYYCYLWDFPSNLSSEDFTYFGEAIAIAPVQLPVNEVSLLADYGDTGEEVDPPIEDPRTIPTLYNFIVDINGNLVMTSGENESFSPDSLEVIDTNVSSVCATINLAHGVILVVYAKGSEVYSFTFDTYSCSEPVLIREFDEEVKEVSIIDGCEATTFLIVGTVSGKNYLISSATDISADINHSTVKIQTFIEFM